MTQSIELVKGELALAKTELLEKARLYSSIEYSGGFESTWSASDGRRVFGIRQARRLAEGHFVIHSHMTIENRVYSFSSQQSQSISPYQSSAAIKAKTLRLKLKRR